MWCHCQHSMQHSPIHFASSRPSNRIRWIRRDVCARKIVHLWYGQIVAQFYRTHDSMRAHNWPYWVAHVPKCVHFRPPFRPTAMYRVAIAIARASLPAHTDSIYMANMRNKDMEIDSDRNNLMNVRSCLMQTPDYSHVERKAQIIVQNHSTKTRFDNKRIVAAFA